MASLNASGLLSELSPSASALTASAGIIVTFLAPIGMQSSNPLIISSCEASLSRKCRSAWLILTPQPVPPTRASKESTWPEETLPNIYLKFCRKEDIISPLLLKKISSEKSKKKNVSLPLTTMKLYKNPNKEDNTKKPTKCLTVPSLPLDQKDSDALKSFSTPRWLDTNSEELTHSVINLFKNQISISEKNYIPISSYPKVPPCMLVLPKDFLKKSKNFAHPILPQRP